MDIEELTALDAKWDKGTNLHHALLLANRHFRKHPNAQPVLLIVTDGEPTSHLEPDGDVYFSYPPHPLTVAYAVRELDNSRRLGAQTTFFRLGDDPGLARFIESMATPRRGSRRRAGARRPRRRRRRLLPRLAVGLRGRALPQRRVRRLVRWPRLLGRRLTATLSKPPEPEAPDDPAMSLSRCPGARVVSTSCDSWRGQAAAVTWVETVAARPPRPTTRADGKQSVIVVGRIQPGGAEPRESAMQFFVSVIDDRTGSATEAEMAAIRVQPRAPGRGSWVFAAGSAPGDSVVIDDRDGAGLFTDGPFVESKEWLSGFWIMEAPDLATARRLAAAASRACHRRVELRPFLEPPA